MESFLDELVKPAEAYRVNLQDIRRGLSELRDGLKRIRQELSDHFTDLEPTELYGRQMWSLVDKATDQVADLTHEVNLADATFNEVVKFYGEEDKNMSSSEFFGVFKTFVTSYKVHISSCMRQTFCSHKSVEMQGGQPDHRRRARRCREAPASSGGVQGEPCQGGRGRWRQRRAGHVVGEAAQRRHCWPAVATHAAERQYPCRTTSAPRPHRPRRVQ